MSYELDPRVMYSWAYQRALRGGLGAADGASFGDYTPECLAWAQTTYDFAAFDRIRTQDVADWLSRSPVARENARTILMPLDFARWERAAGGDTRRAIEDYGRWLDSVAAWVEEGSVLLDRMSKALNLPAWWLVPTNPAGIVVTGATVHLGTSRPLPEAGFVVPSNKIGYFQDLSAGQRGAALSQLAARPSWMVRSPFDWDKNRYEFGDLGSRKKIVGAWQQFKYDSRVAASGAAGVVARRGFAVPAGGRANYSLPPAAVYVPWRSSSTMGVSKSKTGRYDVVVLAGPLITAFQMEQVVRQLTARSGMDVLRNAFGTWGAILQRWAEDPTNPADASARKTLAIAGKSMEVAGAAVGGAGTIAGQPWVAAVGMLITLVGKVFPGLSKVKVRCGPGLVFHKKLGGFCGPPEPLLKRPPSGCAPGTAIALEEQRRKGKGPSLWDQILAALKEWGPYVGVGALGLGAAYLAYRALRKKPNCRRKNTQRRRRGSYYFYARGFVAGREGLQPGEGELTLTPTEHRAFMDGYLAGEQALTALTPTVVSSRR